MPFNYRYNKSNNKKQILSNINITPFVDVVLVLLIIFMVTAPMLNNGYEVKLPKVESNKISISKDKQIILTIDKSRVIRIDNNIIPLDNLTNYLAKYDAKSTQVFIKGDKDTDYGAVMLLMSEVHKNGFNNISLVTDSLNQ